MRASGTYPRTLDPIRFRTALMRWHKSHARQFPWRAEGRSAYHVLIAEALLRKTTALQAAAVYPVVVDEYSSVAELADADVSELRRLLRPLGISDRARLLRGMAATLVRDFGGQVPDDLGTLMRLPGVGRYTASAVLTFAYGHRVGLVDVNVIRVLGRVFEWRSSAKRPHLDRDLWSRAACLLPAARRTAEYHYALLDFAALVCTAKNPKCGACPLSTRCPYRNIGLRTEVAGALRS